MTSARKGCALLLGLLTMACQERLILFGGGRPKSRRLAATRADNQGRFQLPLSPRSDFYLEVTGCGRDSCGNTEFPETFFRHYANGNASGSDLGRLAMAPSGLLRGILYDTLGRPLEPWIGIRGTDHFARGASLPIDPGQGYFVLSAPYPADYGLIVVFGLPGVLNLVNPEARPAEVVLEVKPGAVSDLGIVRVP
jgi:hypothetical protein